MQQKCFENAIIFCYCTLIVSFVAGDIIRQANDVYSTNAIKLRLGLNVVKY